MNLFLYSQLFAYLAGLFMGAGLGVSLYIYFLERKDNGRI